MIGDSITAICTPPGQGALGIIRVSGLEAISIVDGIFSKSLVEAQGYTLHYGRIMEGEQVLDEVVVSVFRGPHSFTKEDVVEISCHGSSFILREVLKLLVKQGARLAEPGEFTQRAFLNGAMDLAQAEAVADLIAAGSAGAHRIAMDQMRGGVSNELKDLRAQLLHLTSLLELELDFGEEDVEFADRTEFKALVATMRARISSLIGSFQYGHAIKSGVPTVIMGKPNAGKSTLLNALLNDNRAIVSDIPGTTRDVVEDRVIIEGTEFRLMDTAGLRETQDTIEAEGVNRTLSLAQKASLILYVYDMEQETAASAESYLQSLDIPAQAHVIRLANKADLVADASNSNGHLNTDNGAKSLVLSASTGSGLNELKATMLDAVAHFADLSSNQAIISNLRHLHALERAQDALGEVAEGLEHELTSDLLAIDLRRVLHELGEITGEISTDEVLGNIFSKFCIGK